MKTFVKGFSIVQRKAFQVSNSAWNNSGVGVQFF